MRRVRYLGTASYSLRDGPTWTEGDVHEVRTGTADRLTARSDFELVGDEASDAPAAAGANEDETEAEPFDADAWLDQDYRERAAQVADGAVDAHLAAIADVETSETVRDAVAERQDEADLNG